MNPKYSFLFLSLITLNASAGITKWVDSSGHVHYSDQAVPSNLNATEVKVHVSPVDEEAAKQKLHDIDADLDRSYKEKVADEAKQKAAADYKATMKAAAAARPTTTTTVTTTSWSTRVPAGQPQLNFNPMGGVVTGGSVSPPPHK